jgi:hypothetical protein
MLPITEPGAVATARNQRLHLTSSVRCEGCAQSLPLLVPYSSGLYRARDLHDALGALRVFPLTFQLNKKRT